MYISIKDEHLFFVEPKFIDETIYWSENYTSNGENLSILTGTI
jgi:hypothetical protein